MTNKFIFLDVRGKRFFKTDLDEKTEGFQGRLSYLLPTGDIDTQRYVADVRDLLDCGWVEIPNPQVLTVNLYYMKESGKYYSTGELHLPRSEVDANPAKSWYNAVETVRKMVDEGNLPGLVSGSRYDVFMSCEEHPCYVPTLVKVK